MLPHYRKNTRDVVCARREWLLSEMKSILRRLQTEPGGREEGEESAQLIAPTLPPSRVPTS